MLLRHGPAALYSIVVERLELYGPYNIHARGHLYEIIRMKL